MVDISSEEEEPGKCRFGLAPIYRITETYVTDDKSLQCNVPYDFSLPELAKLPLDIPIEISFEKS